MKLNAEMKIREMSAKARTYYSGLGQGKLTYDPETNVYYWDDQCGTGEQEMSFEQVQAMFEELQNEIENMED